jgi:hypothetical protein
MPIALSIINDKFIDAYNDMPEDVINIPHGEYKIYGQNAYGRYGYFALLSDYNLTPNKIDIFFNYINNLTTSPHISFLVVGSKNEIFNSIYENYNIRMVVDEIPNLICWPYLENKSIYYMNSKTHSFSVLFGSKLSSDEIYNFIDAYTND